MNKGEYTILEAEILKQKELILRVFESIIELSSKEKLEREQVESLGYRLHNLYCAWEDLFLIVARHFENHIEDKSRYHSELLSRMSLDIPGIRPALLDASSSRILDELRGFRHVFRHAYGVELDIRKIRIIIDDLNNQHNKTINQINTFLEKIKSNLKE